MEYPFAVVEMAPGVPRAGVAKKFQLVLLPKLIDP